MILYCPNAKMSHLKHYNDCCGECPRFGVHDCADCFESMCPHSLKDGGCGAKDREECACVDPLCQGKFRAGSQPCSCGKVATATAGAMGGRSTVTSTRPCRYGMTCRSLTGGKPCNFKHVPVGPCRYGRECRSLQGGKPCRFAH